jgi:hypothetical protein
VGPGVDGIAPETVDGHDTAVINTFALAGARWRNELGLKEAGVRGDSSLDRGWGGRSLGWIHH